MLCVFSFCLWLTVRHAGQGMAGHSQSVRMDVENNKTRLRTAVLSVGKNNLVVHFLKGSRRQNPPRHFTIPTWDLSMVLRDLKGLKVALAPVKRVGDLQALSVSPYCLELQALSLSGL